MDSAKLKAMLERDEGIRLKPYKCTAGKTTIGIGRNLDDVGITKAMAYQMLEEDVAIAVKGCQRIFSPNWDSWSENRQLGWVNFLFNLGFDRASKFKNTIRAALTDDWDHVAEGLKSSLWYKQVGQRADRVIKMICEEAYPYV